MARFVAGLLLGGTIMLTAQCVGESGRAEEVEQLRRDNAWLKQRAEMSELGRRYWQAEAQRLEKP